MGTRRPRDQSLWVTACTACRHSAVAFKTAGVHTCSHMLKAHVADRYTIVVQQEAEGHTAHNRLYGSARSALMHHVIHVPRNPCTCHPQHPYQQSKSAYRPTQLTPQPCAAFLKAKPKAFLNGHPTMSRFRSTLPSLQLALTLGIRSVRPPVRQPPHYPAASPWESENHLVLLTRASSTPASPGTPHAPCAGLRSPVSTLSAAAHLSRCPATTSPTTLASIPWPPAAAATAASPCSCTSACAPTPAPAHA